MSGYTDRLNEQFYMKLDGKHALEMKVASKAPKTSRAGPFSGCEPAQKQWLGALEAAGWNAIVGYGARDAVRKLRALGYLGGESVAVHARACLCAPGEASECPACERFVGWCKRRPDGDEVCDDCAEARRCAK